jgi:N-acetylmuramic acid 6-phosphate etherase
LNHDYSELVTERWNANIPDLSRLNTIEMLEVINREDARVPHAVARVLPQLAVAVDVTAERLKQGGRLFYVGSGTSGRLAVLDAAECVPTFNTAPDLVQAILAGGAEAIWRAREDLEDDPDLGGHDVARAGARSGDVLVGVTASGRTPYVIGALEWGRQQGLYTVAVSCNPQTPVTFVSELTIVVDTGPEVIMGSTRMKAGTAEKLILNMLSTAVMIRLGKTFRNLMVDMRPANQKLRDRAARIVMMVTDCSYDAARNLLENAQWETKVAITMQLLGVDADQARRRLASVAGVMARLTPDE